MMESYSKRLSRRRFLQLTAAGTVGLIVLPSIKATPLNPESKTIKLGVIGIGRQALFLMSQFNNITGVDIVAGCDVYGIKRERFAKIVNAYNSEKGIINEVKTYEKYQDLLRQSDIDAVVIAGPDHSHAMIAIAACKAGKDVYLEKPLTFTIKEGQELRRVVRETNRILAVGSQQRSDKRFQHAVSVVQSGKLGTIKQVFAHVGAPPKPYDLPEEPIPADLNWDLWLANLAAPIHYNHQLNPPISINPDTNEKIWGAWRWYSEMGGGFTTDWGAHMFDIAQWGLGMDKSGPVEISPIENGAEYIKFVYANGTVMTSEPFNNKGTKGVKFIGTDGWLEVSREHFLASDESLMFKENMDDLEPHVSHHLNFIQSVIDRKDPIVPVEIGHRTCTVCTLGNIACQLKRTIKWNPQTELFIDDKDGVATNMLHYQYRDGWSLL